MFSQRRLYSSPALYRYAVKFNAGSKKELRKKIYLPEKYLITSILFERLIKNVYLNYNFKHVFNLPITLYLRTKYFNMNLHEYQAKELIKKYNVPVQEGIACSTVLKLKKHTGILKARWKQICCSKSADTCRWPR